MCSKRISVQNFTLTISAAVVEERLVAGGARQDAGIWEGGAEEEEKSEAEEYAGYNRY